MSKYWHLNYKLLKLSLHNYAFKLFVLPILCINMIIVKWTLNSIVLVLFFKIRGLRPTLISQYIFYLYRCKNLILETSAIVVLSFCSLYFWVKCWFNHVIWHNVRGSCYVKHVWFVFCYLILRLSLLFFNFKEKNTKMRKGGVLDLCVNFAVALLL